MNKKQKASHQTLLTQIWGELLKPNLSSTPNEPLLIMRAVTRIRIMDTVARISGVIPDDITPSAYLIWLILDEQAISNEIKLRLKELRSTRLFICYLLEGWRGAIALVRFSVNAITKWLREQGRPHGQWHKRSRVNSDGWHRLLENVDDWFWESNFPAWKERIQILVTESEQISTSILNNGRYPAPDEWSKRVPVLFKAFLILSLCWLPFLNGEMEGVSFAAYNTVRKKIRNDDFDVYDGFSRVISFNALEQADEEGNSLRDKIEAEAEHFRKSVREAEARTEATLNRWVDGVERKIKSEYKEPIRMKVLKAFTHHVITGGKDVAGDAKTGGLSPKTWFNIRVRLGLKRLETGKNA